MGRYTERLKPVIAKKIEAEALTAELGTTQQSLTQLGNSYEGLSGPALSRRIVAVSTQRRALRESLTSLTEQKTQAEIEEAKLHLEIIAGSASKGHLTDTEIVLARGTATSMALDIPAPLQLAPVENPSKKQTEGSPLPKEELTEEDLNALSFVRQLDPNFDLSIKYGVDVIVRNNLIEHTFTFPEISERYGIREREIRNNVINRGLLDLHKVDGRIVFSAEEVVAIAYFLRKKDLPRRANEANLAVSDPILKYIRHAFSHHQVSEDFAQIDGAINQELDRLVDLTLKLLHVLVGGPK